MNLTSIQQYLTRRFPGLAAIYLFGSRVRGQERADSDIDLAILVDGKLDPVDLWRSSGELEDLAGAPVDLVDLRTASTVMQAQIIETGERLWARDWHVDEFELFVIREKQELDRRRAPLLADIKREGRVHGR